MGRWESDRRTERIEAVPYFAATQSFLEPPVRVLRDDAPPEFDGAIIAGLLHDEPATREAGEDQLRCLAANAAATATPGTIGVATPIKAIAGTMKLSTERHAATASIPIWAAKTNPQMMLTSASASVSPRSHCGTGVVSLHADGDAFTPGNALKRPHDQHANPSGARIGSGIRS